MKKIISIALIVLGFAFTSQAQVTTLSWSGNSGPLDTIVNTGSETAVVNVSSPGKAFSIVLKVLKISGTVGGAIDYQVSNDGTNYATVATDSLTDASANYSYEIATALPWKYVRAKVTGTGTMSASVAGSGFNRQ